MTAGSQGPVRSSGFLAFIAISVARKSGQIVRVAESNPPGPLSWKRLFGGASAAEPAAVQVLVLKKDSEPLLVLPRNGSTAAAALDLYPAQTSLARAAKAFWRLTVPFGWAPSSEHDTLMVDPEDPFLRFLNSLAQGSPPNRTPTTFAILAGNPKAPGRRFLVLVFDPGGKPIAVVKAGLDLKAVKLIEKEVTFLTSATGGTPGLPAIRQRFAHGPLSAFATDYVDGESPGPKNSSGIVPLLHSWLYRDRKLRVDELLAWQRLAEAAKDDDLFARVQRRLSSLKVNPAVFHGDFAPWNIKVSRVNDSWTVLDWDRGEWVGPPAWDWFHFVLQPAILVQRQSGRTLARTAEALLASPAFTQYAESANLGSRIREWLLAYLLHCHHVLKPAEGSPRIPELLKLLSAKWPIT
jgi:hypothetical protein